MNRPSRVSMRREPFVLRISTGRASKNSLAKTMVGMSRLGASSEGIERAEFCFSGFEVTAQGFFDSLAQGGRAFHQNVAQGAKEIRKLLFRPVEHVLREQAAAGAEFDQFDLLGRAQGSPHFVELAGQKAAENGMDVA